MTSERRGSLAAGFAALAVALVVTGLLAETALRLYHRWAAGVPFFSLLPGWRERAFPLDPFLAFGPRVDWQIPGKEHPESAYFNAQGFRTQETLGPPAPGEVRVVALGGSTTEDVWNEAGRHWPLAVEERLHAAGRDDVRVYNGAMSAYTSAHSLVRFATDVVQYQPDLLLVMHNVNDLLVVYRAGMLGVPMDSSYHVKYGQKSLTGQLDEDDVVLCRLCALVRERLARLAPPEPRVELGEYDLRTGLALFERNLRSLVAVARAHGTEVVLVTMPLSRSRERFDDTAALAAAGLLEAFPSHERFLADFDAYNDAIRRVGAELGVPVIDAAALVPQDDALFADIVHTTSAGVEAMGDAVAPELLRLLPPPAGERAQDALPEPEEDQP